MTTPALTVAEFGGKFLAISGYVTPAVLTMIKQSETMKTLIRDYQPNGTFAFDVNNHVSRSPSRTC